MIPAAATPAYLLLGLIQAPHGLHGWLAVQSFTDPPDNLLRHRRWWLRGPDGTMAVYTLRDALWDGHRMRVCFEGLPTRTAVDALVGCEVQIERSELPAAGEREYYRDDLLGFSVRNREGAVLGTVQYFVEAPANAVMVVKGEREHWLPATPPHLQRVDLERREIEVDWPADL